MNLTAILLTWALILLPLILLYFQGYRTRKYMQDFWKKYEEDEKRKRAVSP